MRLFSPNKGRVREQVRTRLRQLLCNTLKIATVRTGHAHSLFTTTA